MNFIWAQELGNFKSLCNVQGPGPIKLEATSDKSSSGSTSANKGDCRRASGSSDCRGRIGEWTSSPLIDRRLKCLIGSVRAMRFELAK